MESHVAVENSTKDVAYYNKVMEEPARVRARASDLHKKAIAKRKKRKHGGHK